MTLLEVTWKKKAKNKGRSKSAKEHKAETNNIYLCILLTQRVTTRSPPDTSSHAKRSSTDPLFSSRYHFPDGLDNCVAVPTFGVEMPHRDAKRILRGIGDVEPAREPVQAQASALSMQRTKCWATTVSKRAFERGRSLCRCRCCPQCISMQMLSITAAIAQ